MVDGEVVATHDMEPQRCNRRRGLFGKTAPHDEGSHLEGKVGAPLFFFIVWHGELRLLTARGSSQVAAEAEGDEAAKPLATTESGQWLGFRVKATYILDLEDEEAPRPVRHHSG